MDIQAIGDEIPVVVPADSKVVVVPGEGAVQLRVHTAKDALVTYTAAEAAVLILGPFKLQADFAPPGIITSAVQVLGEEAAGGDAA